MSQLYSNNAETTLAASLSDSATTATVADGSVFQSPSGSNFELLTLLAAGQFEIVRLTARTGNTLTITRAQESTTARTWVSGTQIFGGVTAGTLAALLQNGGTGFGAMALGGLSSATGSYATAYGYLALADYNNAIALGYASNAGALDTLCVGYGTNVYAQRSSAIGRSVNVYGEESIAAGRSVTSYGNQTVLIGAGGFVEDAGAVAIGNDVYAGGVDSVAIGTLADVDFEVVGGVAIGATSVITTRSMQAAALPVVPRANGLEADAYWKMAGCASVLCSGVLDMTTTQTYTITMPEGVTFFPEEVGVIVTAADTVTGQPSVRFGATGDEARYLAITATTSNAVAERNRWTTLASANGSTTLRVEVTAAATATALSARAYWRGFAVVDAA